MNHDRGRLVKNFFSTRPHLEGEVGVFAIGGQIALIKTAQFPEERSLDHQRGARAVVGFLQNIKDRSRGIIEPTEVPGAAILPDNTPGFLQSAIRIDELGADQAAI